MEPDDHVCLCFRVSLRKLVNHMQREDPAVASQLSECLGAGTGCGWCVPTIEHLHEQHRAGETPSVSTSFDDYKAGRREHQAQKRKQRPPTA